MLGTYHDDPNPPTVNCVAAILGRRQFVEPHKRLQQPSAPCHAPSVISLDRARQIIFENISPLPSRPVALDSSLGHVLASPAIADAAYPSADLSMMDGYVLRAEAIPGSFQIVGAIAAGEISDKSLNPGEAMSISTGATLPENGGRVVMREDCSVEGDTVTIPSFSDSLFVRPRASEASRGDEVLPAGTRIGATEMAILAQIGQVSPEVRTIPKVLHLATGSELVPPSEIPGPGRIRDTNSSLLRGLLAPFGIRPISHRVPDDPAKLSEHISTPCDLLLISGGASVGDHDHGASVLKENGFTIHFDKVNLRPGKPLTFATRGQQAAFVIPGNPVSHFVCFHTAIRLAIEILSGIRPAWEFLDLEIPDTSLLRPNPRETFWPAEVRAENGNLIATPKRWSTSGDTFSLASTNALIRINDGPPFTLLLDLPSS